MDEKIREQLRSTYMTGGTGVITMKNGDSVHVRSSTIELVGTNVVAQTEAGTSIRIPKSLIESAEPLR